MLLTAPSRPLGSDDAEIEDLVHGGQAQSAGLSKGAWIVEVGSPKDEKCAAVDSLDDIKACITSLVRSRHETKLLVVTRKVSSASRVPLMAPGCNPVASMVTLFRPLALRRPRRSPCWWRPSRTSLKPCTAE